MAHHHGREKVSVQNSMLAFKTLSQKERASLLLIRPCPKQIMWLNLTLREKGSVPRRRSKLLVGGQDEMLLEKCKVLAQSLAHDKLWLPSSFPLVEA